MVLNRVQAFIVHLLLSLFVFAVLLLLLWQYFFPGALFAAGGAWEGLRIVVLVDLVLGPLLTLVVFSKKKPRSELRRDLTWIGLIQVAGLVGGLYALNWVRPLMVVHVYDTFYVHNHESLKALGISDGVIQEKTGWLPRFYYVDMTGRDESFIQDHVRRLLDGKAQFQNEIDNFLPWPDSLSEQSRLLRQADISDEGCVRLGLSTAYRQGSVCFEMEPRRLDGFKPDS